MKTAQQIFMLCLLWMVGMSASAKIFSGDCGENGDNVKWSFDSETGELIISGEGNMKDYQIGSYPPWHLYCTSIYSAQIDDRVTSIGGYAFF